MAYTLRTGVPRVSHGQCYARVLRSCTCGGMITFIELAHMVDGTAACVVVALAVMVDVGVGGDDNVHGTCTHRVTSDDVKQHIR